MMRFINEIQMSNHVLLDNITHKDLRVVTKYSKEYGDDVATTPTFITELADVSREYPVFLRQTPEDETYQAIVLFGFEPGENLFLDDDGWNASYVPAAIARGPFLIGFQDREESGQPVHEAVVHVDMASKRISEDGGGEPIFLEHGGNTPYLERVNALLHAIHDGLALNQRMFAAFEKCGLIEPVAVEVELADGSQRRISGYFTISEEKLAQLDGAALADLNAQGFLKAAFLIANSLNNMQKLIQMKNKQLTA